MPEECLSCGFYDSDRGCACPSIDKWYACPLEPEPTVEEECTGKPGLGYLTVVI